MTSSGVRLHHVLITAVSDVSQLESPSSVKSWKTPHSAISVTLSLFCPLSQWKGIRMFSFLLRIYLVAILSNAYCPHKRVWLALNFS